MKVGEIITRARDILQDRDEVRWKQHELIWWINDAYTQLVQKRPDAFTKLVNVVLPRGTRSVNCDQHSDLQEAVGIVDVLINWRVGYAQVTDARSVRLIDRSILNDQLPRWRETGGTHIKFWTRDTGSPRAIEIFPMVLHAAGQHVEIAVSMASSASHGSTGVNDPLKIQSEVWAPVILDYVLYRAYSKDAEYTANAERAAVHYNRVQEALKLNTPGEAAIFNMGIRPMDHPTMVNPHQPT